MAYEKDNCGSGSLARSEGEWIADVLRVWDEDRREWSTRLPVAIRLEPMDLIVYAEEGEGLGWRTGPLPSAGAEPSCAARDRIAIGGTDRMPDTASARETPGRSAGGCTYRGEEPGASLDVCGMQNDDPPATCEFVRFPALSQAIGARIEKATAIHGDSAVAPKAHALEFTLDTDTILRVSLQKDGTILARLSPSFDAPKPRPAPQAVIPFARRENAKAGR